MKQFLKKPMGLAVAATIAMGGMAAHSTASADIDANALGDLALVPYYTVRDNFVTGVHITNTTSATQVVKLRLRRGTDSADALDFNLILSPWDVWTGTVNDNNGQLGFTTTDNSCTAPAANGTDGDKPKFVAPNTFIDGADEGYIEVIGMGQALDENQNIAINAKHQTNDGEPLNCNRVRENFFAARVLDNDETENAAGVSSEYVDTPENALKVSYFIRDTASGMEMGDNAQHIVNFATDPMMTNQQLGLNSGDVNGFDFPDLDGGGANAANRGLYDSVIRADLGSAVILNDYSYNSANGVATDWVVTIPGQYLMDDPSTNGSVVVDGQVDPAGQNHRDLPVTAQLKAYDREEGEADEVAGELVISPNPAGEVDITLLTEEVNVIEWGGQSVFNTAKATEAQGPGINGWATLSVSSDPTSSLEVFDLTVVNGDGDLVGTGTAVTNPVPVIGFAAWQRTFAEDSNRNYGRIIAHSRK